MKLFILAAGTGSRLLPLTKNTPKSLIKLGDGTTLLERQLNGAAKSGLFNEIVVITGYLADHIDSYIERFQQNIKISTFYNPFYEISNNIVSIWAVHRLMLDDDFMITNGDNLYQDHVYGQAVQGDGDRIQVTIDHKKEYDSDDMKVTLGNDKRALKIHKEITPELTHAESVGFALVKGMQNRQKFVKATLDLVRKKEMLSLYWLVIFNELAGRGERIETVEISHDDWKEFDFHPDMDILNQVIRNNFR